jgi:hypothetical protein
LVAALMVACASKPQIIQLDREENSSQITVEDLRPQTEKEGRSFSLVIFDPAYALRRVGESAVTPKAMRVLQHRYHEKSQKRQATLRVRHLVAYTSVQAVARGSASSYSLSNKLLNDLFTTNDGRVKYGSSVIDARDAFESTEGDNEFVRAYPGTDLYGYVVYIDTEVDGKRLLTRTIVQAPSKEPLGDHAAQAIDQAIRFHVDQR